MKRVIRVDAKTCAPLGEPTARAELLPAVAPGDPAYVFFTSGTTGAPKGVRGSHKGLSHFLTWQRDEFRIEPSDRLAQLTGLSFDVLMRDVFLGLVAGATLVVPAEGQLAPDDLLRWMEDEKISVVHAVPTVARSWLGHVPAEVQLRHLKHVFFAGEPLSADLVHRWRQRFSPLCVLVNLYGPTETTLAKCFYRVPAVPRAGIQPVGVALPQSQALVLSPGGNLCAVGEAGEIVIRTPFRSLGYINAGEADHARFYPNPSRQPPDLLYRTGDGGRYLPDGTLEILGRLDDQLKIRGMRVEPAEVEAVIRRLGNVREVAVLGRRFGTGDLMLVAYVVPADPAQGLTMAVLREELRQVLPDYMLPAAVVSLRQLPITRNGKLDRAALPEPEFDRESLGTKYAAPAQGAERQLAEIWKQLLGVAEIGAHDNFFDLGGHSLLLIEVHQRVRAQFAKPIALLDLFRHPTVAQLAKFLSGEDQQPNAVALGQERAARRASLARRRR
jgi:amino acid adenylation domain-containing protein